MEYKAENSHLPKLLCLCLFLSFSNLSNSDIVIVGNLNAPELSKKLAKQIFLKKIDVLPNGVTATPIDLTDNNDVKWNFYQKIAGKKPAQIHSYWSRAVFSGRGSPPDQVHSVAELKRRLSKDTGAIGYIDEKDVSADMKVLLRISI